jgi:hypothetical protein
MLAWGVDQSLERERRRAAEPVAAWENEGGAICGA